MNSTSWIITPNNRLASHWRQSFEAKTETPVFASPHCLPYLAFLEDRWQKLSWAQACPLLLNTRQHFRLWQDILQADTQHLLLDTQAATELVIKAYHLCQDFEIRADQDPLKYWVQDFERLCQERHYLSPAQLTGFLCEHAAQLAWPECIELRGFLEFSPAQERLWQTLRNLGVKMVISPPSTTATAPSKLLAFSSVEEEIQAMAEHLIQAALEHPAAQVAAVVQDLETLRPTLLRVFRTSPVEVNISGGAPLAQEPLIHHALSLLSLRQHQTAENISLYLFSPYTKGAAERGSERALQDAHYRKTRYPQDSSFLDLPEMQAFFQRPLPKMAAFSTWASHFTLLLRDFAWPGDLGLDSLAYQALQKFHTCLDLLASLDVIAEPVSFGTALSELRKLCQDTLFQAQDRKPRIHILGMLESLGLEFDLLWIMNMEENRWPASPRPNPYLPIEVQKHLNFPRATAQREKAFAEQVTNIWQAAAPRITFSYTKIQEGLVLAPSALLRQLALTEMSPDPSPLPSVALEPLSEDPLPFTNPGLVRGGSRIFKLQALCPFRAFAELRLLASEFPEATEGLTPQIRGQLLHKTLELIWQNLKTQKVLLAHENLPKLVSEKIRDAFQVLPPVKISETQIRLETERLANMIQAFLELEKHRLPFEIAMLEKKIEVQFAHLSFHVQMDRLDRLMDGSYALIDYKTGEVSISTWWEARLSEPQLPLYAVTSPLPIESLAFAEIHSQTSQFKGVYAEHRSLPLPKLKPIDLSAQMQKWRHDLAKLAEDFLAGITEVDPKNGTQTCRSCHLSPFCRVKTRQA